jgi:hypothetical protein
MNVFEFNINLETEDQILDHIQFHEDGITE